MSAAGTAPAPADDTSGDTSAADDTAAPADGTSTDQNVLCTVVSNGDGSFTVYAGDEPDEAEESAEGAPAGGAAAPDEEDQGKQCASVGAALKAVLDILKEAEASSGAEGSSQDQFSAGFDGGSSASPAKSKSSLAQKY